MSVSIKARIAQIHIWLHRGSFGVNAALLTGGTFLSQAVLLIASPVLTRVYTPAEFGVYGMFSFFFSVLVAINSFRYEFAIPLPEDENQAQQLAALCLSLVVGTTILFIVLIGFIGHPLAVLLRVQPVEVFWPLLPFSLLLAGILQVFDYWSTRKKAFAQIAKARLSQNITQTVVQIGSGIAALGPLGLILGQITGFFLAILVLRKPPQLYSRLTFPKQLLQVAKTYRNFPLFTTWASLLDVASAQLPTVLFATYFSVSEAGFFLLALRILGLPSTVISQAVAQAFYPAIVEKGKDAVAVRKFIEQLAILLLVISASIFIFVALNGETLFSFVFGATWSPTGRYARYLALWFILSFVTSPLSTFALVKNKQREGLMFTVILTTLRIGAIWIGAQLAVVADLAVIIFSIVNVVVYFAYFVWLLNIAGSSLTWWLRQASPFIGVSLLIVGCTLVLQQWLHPLIPLVISAAGLGCSGVWFWRKHKGMLYDV